MEGTWSDRCILPGRDSQLLNKMISLKDNSRSADYFVQEALGLMEAWLSIFLGDEVIPTNDTLKEGKKKNGIGRVMLDDVSMHVRNLSFQHGADPVVKSN